MPIFNPFRATFNQSSNSEISITNNYSVVSVNTVQALEAATEFPKLVLLYNPSLTDKPELYTWVDNPSFQLDDPRIIQSAGISSRYWVPVNHEPQTSIPIADFEYDPYLNPANFVLNSPGWNDAGLSTVVDGYQANNLIPQSRVWKSNRGVQTELLLNPIDFLTSLDIGTESYSGKKALRIPAGYVGKIKFPIMTADKIGLSIVYKGKNISFSRVNDNLSFQFSVKGIEDAIATGGGINRAANQSFHYVDVSYLEEAKDKPCCASFMFDFNQGEYWSVFNLRSKNENFTNTSLDSFPEISVNNLQNDEDAYIYEIVIYNDFLYNAIILNENAIALTHYDENFA